MSESQFLRVTREDSRLNRDRTLLLVARSYIRAWSRSLSTMQSRNGTSFGSGNAGKKPLLPISSVTKTAKRLSDLNVDYPVEEDHWPTWPVVLHASLNT